MRTVLILGSAPDAPDAALWPHAGFDAIIAINNAWAVRPDWDYLIHPEDFPDDRLPASVCAGQVVVTAADYVPVQNAYGGFVYAGGTMAFTAGYWALGALKPDVLAFFGCDMNYSAANTHFYGQGAADPLRKDITLQSLEAKSARLMLLAAGQDCLTVNLSRQPHSRLLFPRMDRGSATGLGKDGHRMALAAVKAKRSGGAEAIRREAALGYMARSGRYWEEADRFDPAELRKLDALWLAAVKPLETVPQRIPVERQKQQRRA